MNLSAPVVMKTFWELAQLLLGQLLDSACCTAATDRHPSAVGHIQFTHFIYISR